MPPTAVVIDDSDYASEEDSDFAPDAAPPAASDRSSASESEAESGDEKPFNKPKKRKRATGHSEEAEDVGFENSGDEEIVERGLKRQRRKGKKGHKDEDENDGGEGGFVKTRRMAALVLDEKKPLATTASATVDVDALWASMTNGGAEQTVDQGAQDATAAIVASITISPKTAPSKQQIRVSSSGQNAPAAGVSQEPEGDDMIMIQRTYNFAGKVHVEEKLVPRDSAEARLWLQSQPSGKGNPKPSDPNVAKPLRPPKKARRSIFEPITEPLPQRTDLQFGVNSISRNGNGPGGNAGVQAKKLNTVEKSKMDWAGFVDKEGIKDELETAGKAKGAYLDQKEFLARVEEKREDEARRARTKV